MKQSWMWSLSAAAVLAGLGTVAMVRGLAADEAPAPVPMSDAGAQQNFADMTLKEFETATEGMSEEEVGRLIEDMDGDRASMQITWPDLGKPDAPEAVQASADDCSPQPEPAWFEPLESVRVLLLRDLYEARTYEGIIAAGDCPCALRKPAWDAIEAEYLADYASADLRVVEGAWDDFRRTAARLRPDARSICRPQGTW